MFRRAVRHFTEELKDELERDKIMSRQDLHTMSAVGDTRRYNLARMHAYAEIFENGFKETLERYQRELGQVLFKVIIQTLLDNDWEALGPDIMLKKHWDTVSRLALSMTARRMGKSRVLARHAVAFLEVLILFPLPDKDVFDITIFSKTLRQATGLGRYIKEFAAQRGLDRFKTVSNMERMEFRPSKDSQKMISISSFPGESEISFLFSPCRPPQRLFIYLHFCAIFYSRNR